MAGPASADGWVQIATLCVGPRSADQRIRQCCRQRLTDRGLQAAAEAAKAEKAAKKRQAAEEKARAKAEAKAKKAEVSPARTVALGSIR